MPLFSPFWLERALCCELPSATVYIKIWQAFRESNEGVEGEVHLFQNIVSWLGPEIGQGRLAQSVRETQWVIVEGSSRSAEAHGLSHGNGGDNLTPVDQTDLQTDCTQSGWCIKKPGGRCFHHIMSFFTAEAIKNCYYRAALSTIPFLSVLANTFGIPKYAYGEKGQ